MHTELFKLLVLHGVLLAELDADHAALIKADVKSQVLVIPVHAPCLQGERLGPELLKAPAVDLALLILTQLHPEAGHCSDGRVHLVIITRILLLLLLPRHGKVGDVAVQSGADVHFTHGDEK